jgi:hypothetical protein
VSWAAYFDEAGVHLDAAIAEQTRLWLAENVRSEGYIEAEERTARARQRWEERLTALNAYWDWQNR